jgi:hypothetical protein
MMAKGRPQARHPALPGTTRTKAGAATALSARDAKSDARAAQMRFARRKTNLRKPG